jgi:hypothetical protein
MTIPELKRTSSVPKRKVIVTKVPRSVSLPVKASPGKSKPEARRLSFLTTSTKRMRLASDDDEDEEEEEEEDDETVEETAEESSFESAGSVESVGARWGRRMAGSARSKTLPKQTAGRRLDVTGSSTNVVILVAVAMLCISLFTSRSLDWITQGGVQPMFGQQREVAIDLNRVPQLERDFHEWQMQQPAQHAALELQITAVRSEHAEDVVRVQLLEVQLAELQQAAVRSRLEQLELAVVQWREAATGAAAKEATAAEAARIQGVAVVAEAALTLVERRAVDARMVALEGQMVVLQQQQEVGVEQRGDVSAVGERVADLERSLAALAEGDRLGGDAIGALQSQVARWEQEAAPLQAVPGIQQAHRHT